MTTLLIHLKDFARDTRGSIPVEYGMLAFLIAIACVGAMSAIGQSTNTKFADVQTTFK
jgi:Flp pilus assembly pilin Flp